MSALPNDALVKKPNNNPADAMAPSEARRAKCMVKYTATHQGIAAHSYVTQAMRMGLLSIYGVVSRVLRPVTMIQASQILKDELVLIMIGVKACGQKPWRLAEAQKRR